jgi:hypothetical protein
MANRKPTLTFWALIVLLCLTLTIIAIRFITQAVALFMSQQVVSANTFTTNALIAPTQLTASAVGRDVQLGWKASGNSDGYVVLGGANGNSNDCVTATLSVISTTHNLNYVDNSRHTPQGTWFCYQTQTRLRSWQSLSNNPRVAVQLGFVATSIRLINDGNHSGCNGSDRNGLDKQRIWIAATRS